MLLKTMGQRNGELLGFKDGGLWGAAAGLSGLLRGLKTGRPLPSSSSSRRSAGRGPASVSVLAG
jgi:hypothetical protein